jgi:hypothetical protein
MKRSLMAVALAILGTGTVLAGPPAPVQAPDAVQAPKGAVQGPTQSPAQSPVQKGAYSAGVDSGYRSYSYQPQADYGSYDSYGSYGRTMRRNQPAWTNVTNKALGRY